MEKPQIRKYLYAKAAREHTPLSGVFELTARCNMDCKMCYVRLTKQEQERIGREREADEWIALGRECRDKGMLFLLITGGEPFLRQDFRKIYESLHDMGLMISINTNGTLITAEQVEWLKERPPVKVNVTLYGESRATYETLCGYADGYDRAVSAILMLKAAGIFVSINASYTGENSEDVDKIFDFTKAHDLPIRMTSYMFPPVRKGEQKKDLTVQRTPPKLAGDLMFRSVQLKYGEEKWGLRKQQLLAGLPSEDGDCPRDEKMRCMAGRSSFWITWNWQLRACGMMTMPTLPVSVEGFSQVWKTLGIEIDKIRLPKACTTCRLRSVCIICGAVAQAECGSDVEKRPEYLCRMMQEYVRLLQQEIRGGYSIDMLL